MLGDATEISNYFVSNEKHGTMPPIVYHYCSPQTFLSIMSTSTLRLSNIAKSNDLQEINYITPYLSEAIHFVTSDYNKLLSSEYKISPDAIDKVVQGYFNELSMNFYVACFSAEKDLLSQWTRYADDARGIAIGFNTSEFATLQESPYNGFVFGNIIYDPSVLRQQLIEILRDIIERKWCCDDDAYNQNLLINSIESFISTFLYYSVLYKNQSFFEENEWRLIYNPLGRIRRVTDLRRFFDRIKETNQYSTVGQGFQKKPIQFMITRNNISSYIDLDFSNTCSSLVSEIIIGPSSKIERYDKDLLMLLNMKGYRVSDAGIEGGIKISKSKTPYLSKT